MIERKVSPERRALIREIFADPAKFAPSEAQQLVVDLCDDAAMLDERLTITLLAGATVLMQLRPGLTLPEATMTFGASVEAAIADHQRRHNNEQN